jgi:hypothetical protein
MRRYIQELNKIEIFFSVEWFSENANPLQTTKLETCSAKIAAHNRYTDDLTVYLAWKLNLIFNWLGIDEKIRSST